jgi:hypothetical protein
MQHQDTSKAITIIICEIIAVHHLFDVFVLCVCVVIFRLSSALILKADSASDRSSHTHITHA